MPKKTDETAKPRLKNLDALFQLDGSDNPLEKAVPIIETQPEYRRAVTSIEIEKLTPFNGHPFRLYEGERLDDMVSSIKANGVLVPIIVRRVDVLMEILAGHNRVKAAGLAGLKEVPTIVFDNISDEDAMVYVVETNLIQRSFSDMSHSEKAAVIALHHSKMFSQGKRNDILEQLEMLEKPHEDGENGTFAQVGQRLNSREIVAKEYNLSRNTVARYLRVNQLITELKFQLDNGGIAFIPAVSLSFLSESEQTIIVNCMEKNQVTVDMKKAEMLRKLSENGRLNKESILRVLTGSMEYKPNRTPTVKVSKTVYSKYFKPNQSPKDIQGIVEKALDLYFGQQ